MANVPGTQVSTAHPLSEASICPEDWGGGFSQGTKGADNRDAKVSREGGRTVEGGIPIRVWQVGKHRKLPQRDLGQTSPTTGDVLDFNRSPASITFFIKHRLNICTTYA